MKKQPILSWITSKQRNGMIVLLLGFLVLIVGFTVVRAATAPAASDYAALQTTWLTALTGGAAYNAADPDISQQVTKTTQEAQTYWTSLNKATSRTYLWSDLASTTQSSAITSNYTRLRSMARAYATTGSSLQNNISLRTDIINGLEWMNTNRYGATKSEYDNWWDWEIGAPLQLNDTVILLYSSLSSAQRTKYMAAVDHFTPVVEDTGANRVWKATVVGIRGVIVQDSAKIAMARDGLSGVFPYVTTGDGFYKDGSFVQHSKQAATGAYGNSLLFDISNLLYLLDGSYWDVTDPNKQNVYKWVYDNFEPLIYKGAMMDMVMGRVISRYNFQDHIIGQGVIEAIIRLSETAPPADAAAYKSMVKYWITADTYQSFIASSPVSYIIPAKQILADDTVAPKAELIKTKLFPSMDRAVHLRPGFGFGISMFSNRIYNYESINKENFKGWYTGDGMTYLYNNDLGQYGGDFWETVNPYRLPGTTIDTQTRANSSGAGWSSPNSWTGGSELLGKYASVGMDLKGWNSTLKAKKSWFMIGDEIAALGAGISSTDSRSILTTIDNRKISNANSEAVTVDGVVQPTTLGKSTTTTGNKWVNIENTGGYYFPQSQQMTLTREARSGKWTDINTNPSFTNSSSVTRNYVTMTANHGSNPTSGSYSYVVLPNETAAQTQSYAQNPQISIVANTAKVQAVREATEHVLGANFWQAGSASYVTSSTPASTTIKEDGPDYAVAASDPMQSQSKLTIELDKTAASVTSKDPTITILSLSPTIKFEVNVAGAKGQTQNVAFAGVQDTGAGLLSFNKTTTASSVDSTNSTTIQPKNTTDSNYQSRWASLRTDSQWLQIDLGALHTLKYAKLAWETAYGKNYNIQVSPDDKTWTTAFARTNGKGGSETIALPAGTQGRYVRMQGVTRGTTYGYSLWEMQVFGS